MKRTIALAVLSWWLPASVVVAEEPPQSTSTFYRENLLRNGSFEEGLKFWTKRLGARQDGDVIESILEIDSKTAQEGAQSVTVYGNSLTTRWHALESENVTLEHGQRYRLAGWIKSENVTRETGQYANSNFYIQFRDKNGKVVDSGMSPVRVTARVVGTSAWHEVDLTFTAPENADFVRVGLALTMSGQAWFDNVRLSKAEEFTWFRKDTQRFLYMSQDEGVPNPETAAANEAYFERVAKSLDMPFGKRIRYFKYTSVEEKKRITGNDAEAHVEGDDLHALSWNDRRDVAYLIVSRLGPSHPFLVRGATYYLEQSAAGGDPHHGAKELMKINAIPPLAVLMDPGSFSQLPEAAQKFIPMSFAAFLIEKYGMEQFKKLYPFASPEEARAGVASRFQTVYMNPMPVVDAEWRAMLNSTKP